MGKKFFFFAALCCAMMVNAAEKALPDSTIWESAVDGSKEKTVYTYDANGNQTSVSRYKWDKDANKWVGYAKHEYTWYNSELKSSDIQYNSWDEVAQNWIPASKEEWTYDAGNHELLNILSFWDTNTQAWMDRYKYEYSYDERGNKLSQMYFTRPESEWGKVNKSEYTYDDQNNLLSETQYDWDSYNNVWVPSYLGKFEFRADGKQSDDYVYKWNQTNASWENFLHTVYVYLPPTDILYGKVTKIWEDNDWKNYSTCLYTYAGEERIASELTAYWSSEAEEWIYDEKKEYTYNDEGELLSQAMYDWNKNTEAWVGDWKYENIEDEESGLSIGYIFYVWDNNDWRYYDKVEATYDEEGNLLLVTTYAWTTDLHMWVKIDEETYYYPAASEAIDEIFQTPTVKSQKLLKNGQLFITSDGKMYNVTGVEIK